MNENTRERLMLALQHVHKRPGMHFSNDLPGVVNFLSGFNLACRLLAPALYDDDVYRDVIKARGWEKSAMSIQQQMQARGYTDEAIVKELLAIEIALVEAITLEPESTEKKA